MKRWFICHGELAYIAGLVRKLGIKCIFAPAKWFSKSIIESNGEFIRPAKQLYQVPDIMLNIPPVSVCIVLIIVIPCTHSSRKLIIERHYEVTFTVLWMKKS